MVQICNISIDEGTNVQTGHLVLKDYAFENSKQFKSYKIAVQF